MPARANQELLRRLFETSEKDQDRDAAYLRLYSSVVNIGKGIAPDLIAVLTERIRHHHETKSLTGQQISRDMDDLFKQLGVDPKTDAFAQTMLRNLDADPSERRKQGISEMTYWSITGDLSVAAQLINDLGITGIQEFCSYLQSRDLSSVAISSLVLFSLKRIPPSVVMAIASAPVLYVFLTNEPERELIRQLLMETLSRSPVSSTVHGMMNDDSMRSKRTDEAEHMIMFYVAAPHEFKRLVDEHRRKR